ncbi:recombination directionality factor [Paralysiella testudinis]|uniref:Hydrolase or metal-binding protein n=1 Tax=Paralysiella testudinis TaxID=2809020 RepID=A0A892ZGH7_9NEIS|nr:hypothetical protein [Paralysiella testudinis]QRQ80846.1 hypothetical protein JQU52_08785 [Paralysiella testudinis]
MLKGLALTPPIIGRIAIGKTVERNGKHLPEKDDEFTLTTQVQNKSGWINHPLDAALRQQSGKSDTKLRCIPIRLLFDAPDLNLRACYSLFDRQSGRPLCVGNGENCKRMMNGQAEQHPCPGPDYCPLGANQQCKPYARMNVRIGDEDELGSFVFRTTGFNSIRTLSARLHYFHAAANGMLSTLPLALRLRSKSTTQSYRAPIYYVDLVVRDGFTLNEAIQQAQNEYHQRQQAGFNQPALDEAARMGFAAGVFEESEEDGQAVVAEFLPPPLGAQNTSADNTRHHNAPNGMSTPLADKLAGKAARLSTAS